MSCEIHSLEDGRAVFICTTTDTAFGPVFKDYETASLFEKWLPFDPRGVAMPFKWQEFSQLDKRDCLRCGELMIMTDKIQLCDDCRACDFCGNVDVPIHDRGPLWGWLCDNCSEVGI